MVHTYRVTGMTCGGCEASVKNSLLQLPGITGADISKEKESAIITTDFPIELTTLQNALNKKYTISEIAGPTIAEPAKNWLQTYKPILVIFGYITAISVIAATQQNTFNWMQAMSVFMAGFFLTFSFFKMLDLQGFANSYAMYDIIAKQVKAWGYIYAFVELSLGLAYATGFHPQLTNIVTLTVMSISIIGVLQSVLNKRTIQCACLGSVFNLPMSTVTIIEDGLMIGMSGVMLVAGSK